MWCTTWRPSRAWFPHLSSIGIHPGAGHSREAAVQALGPSQTSAGLCSSHLSHQLLPGLLSFQMILIGQRPRTADPAGLLVVHEGWGPAVGFGSLFRNGSVSLIKLGSQGLRSGTPQASVPTRAIWDACCFCRTCWNSGGWSEQWELGPGQQRETAAGCSCVSS